MDLDEKNLRTDRIQAVLVEALRVSPDMITPDLALGDLPQWDSMGHMEVMMCLEQYFGIEINNETIAALTSVPAIQTYLDSQDGASAPNSPQENGLA